MPAPATPSATSTGERVPLGACGAGHWGDARVGAGWGTHPHAVHPLAPPHDAGAPPTPQSPGDAASGVEPHGARLLPGLECGGRGWWPGDPRTVPSSPGHVSPSPPRPHLVQVAKHMALASPMSGQLTASSNHTLNCSMGSWEAKCCSSKAWGHRGHCQKGTPWPLGTQRAQGTGGAQPWGCSQCNEGGSRGTQPAGKAGGGTPHLGDSLEWVTPISGHNQHSTGAPGTAGGGGVTPTPGAPQSQGGSRFQGPNQHSVGRVTASLGDIRGEGG